MWGVNKAKPEEQKIVAWDFVRFMLAKPDEWLAKAAFVQPVKGVNETQVAKNFPFFDVHMKDVSTATWYIRSEYTNEIGQAVGRAIERDRVRRRRSQGLARSGAGRGRQGLEEVADARQEAQARFAGPAPCPILRAASPRP